MSKSSQKESAPSPADSEQNLNKLKDTILKKHKECMDAEEPAAVAAWQAGKALLSAKKSKPKGGFTKWRESLTGISSATSSRYLKLAKEIKTEKDLKRKFKEAGGLTELYREVGALKKKDTEPPNAVHSFLKRVESLSDSASEARKVKSPHDWESDEKSRFLAAIDPILKIHREIEEEDNFNRGEQG